MKVEQITVFLKNRPGTLAEITSLLAENGINIRALSLGDTTEEDILRIIVNDTGKARDILIEDNYVLTVDEVIVVETPDRPGGLANVLTIVKNAGLNIEFLYAFSQKSGASGLVILGFSDPDRAAEVFLEHQVRVLSTEEIYAI